MKNDLMVVPSDCWKRDPLQSLSPKELMDEDWRHIVNLGFGSNPETMLLEPREMYIPAVVVRGECLQTELDFIAGVLERRMMEEKCRDSIEESRIALRARLMSPEALSRQIARLHKQLLALGGKQGADRHGKAIENVREALKKQKALEQKAKEQKGVPR